MFRNYVDSEFHEKIENTYKNMLEKQTVRFAKQCDKKYKSPPYIKQSIWDVISSLEKIHDESDPDNDLPQIVHAYQTAELIKTLYLNDDGTLKHVPIKDLFSEEEWDKMYTGFKTSYTTLQDYYNIKDWSWFPLVGFIHDLGKIMLTEEFGELPQWAVVGDTFPLGSKLAINFPFYDKRYHRKNTGLSCNIYKDHCGFDKVFFSWGHDEYLASVLERNKTRLPKEAIYIIRYHSFYSWHTPNDNKRCYENLASCDD